MNIKEYEKEQREKEKKVKELKDMKIQDILDYNNMLNQKRTTNLELKLQNDKAWSQEQDMKFNKLNQKLEMANKQHDDDLNEKRKEIRQENEAFKEKVIKF